MRAVDRSNYPNEIRIINPRPIVTNPSYVQEIAPVATISGSPPISTGYYSKPTIPFINPPVNNGLSNVSQYEASWRAKFPRMPIFILSISQFIFTVLIFILEIASLATWNHEPTAVGIWCAIPFAIACISMSVLGKYFVCKKIESHSINILIRFLVYRKDSCRMWATRVLIAQICLLVFTFVLIGIKGDYVQKWSRSISLYHISSNTIDNPFSNKYRIVQAQLAFGILLMFTGFTYIAIYGYVTYTALWRPHHTLDTDHLFQ